MKKHEPVCSDLQELLAAVEKYEGKGQRLFRGQPRDFPLLPKIARADPCKATEEMEREMLAEFRRRSTLFIRPEQVSDEWELMVYAQHHGMATRLLDWTTNPMAALWFACSETPDSDGYVFLLNAESLLLDRAKRSSPFSEGKTRVFKPNLNNDRIVAQSGWFTLHSYSRTAGRYVPIESNPDVHRHMVRVAVRARAKKKILKKLDVFGINQHSLFPDVVGICRHVNWIHGV
jgi:hypothetical protein